MKLVQWNPNREMRTIWNTLDRMWDQDPVGKSRPESRRWGLAVDVMENEENYTLTASVPGIDPADIDVTFEDGLLTIRGEAKVDESVNAEDFRLRERRYGTFSRSIRFPVEVQADHIEASYEQGLLTLTLPKAEEVKPKRIAVNVNAK